MNDLAARFLMVLGSESLTFWCMNNYFEHLQSSFMASGMLRKIGVHCLHYRHLNFHEYSTTIESLKHLLQELDPDLSEYLRICGSEDLIFCHKYGP